MKLKPKDIDELRERMRSTMVLREGESRVKITVHMGTCGIASGAREILHAFIERVKKDKVEDVIVTTSGCAGLCNQEPMATVELKGEPPVKYTDLTPEKADKIFAEHVQEGTIVTEYALALGSERLL